MVEDAEKEVDIKEYLNLALRYKYIIGSIVLLFLVMGIVAYKLEVPVYSATATLVAESDTTDSKYSLENEIDSDIVAALAKSSETVSRMMKELGLLDETIIPDMFTTVRIKLGLTEDPYNSFLGRVRYYRNNINVQQEDKGNIIRITTTDQNPKIAADIANKIAEIVLDNINRERNSKVSKSIKYIDEQLNVIRNLLSEDRKKLVELEMSGEYHSVIELNEKIQDGEKLLRQYNDRIKFYDTKLALEFSDPGRWENRTEFREEKEKYEYEKSYYEDEVERLTQELEVDKEMYNRLDKTDFYRANELISIVKMDESIYANLLNDKQSLIIGELFTPTPLRFLSRAWTPTFPDRLRGIQNIIIFLGLGMVVSFGIVSTLQFFDKRFSDVEEIEEELGLNVLGTVPKIKNEEKMKDLEKSPFVEAYKTLRTNIHFTDKKGKLKVLGITSAEADTGKSFIIKHLANTMANSKDRVLVIDCDLRNPSLHSYFKVKRRPGLTDILIGNAKLDKAIVKVKRNLYVLPSGSLHYNPQQLIESKEMNSLLEDVKKKYDMVLCDSIPVLTTSDAELLAALVDSNIFVVNSMKSKKEDVINAKKLLNKINVPILGAVLNNKKDKGKQYYYKK
ncbi:polysaccharide biosynthesis tyrosine autokinase [Candidatus Woesearchaeota archaeon]|nr:polysaccharide biosynthesis tyrosine autokinase [Candidatus Woesearchaeota archaeon]